MGKKYCVTGRLNGYCKMNQACKYYNTLIGWIISIIIFRFKYPIVDATIRNGYSDCEKCVHGGDLLCSKDYDKASKEE